MPPYVQLVFVEFRSRTINAHLFRVTCLIVCSNRQSDFARMVERIERHVATTKDYHDMLSKITEQQEIDRKKQRDEDNAKRAEEKRAQDKAKEAARARAVEEARARTEADEQARAREAEEKDIRTDIDRAIRDLNASKSEVEVWPTKFRDGWLDGMREFWLELGTSKSVINFSMLKSL
jgi:hypothetical protein